MRYAPGVLALLVVGACTVGPNYKSPTPPKVAGWRDPSTRPGGAARTISSTTDPDPQLVERVPRSGAQRADRPGPSGFIRVLTEKGRQAEGSSSFLKKRTKKPLPVKCST
jgi:hypothetical protein